MSSQLEKYFYDIVIECPYGLPFDAVYRQAQFSNLPNEILKFFLESGFRRNGNYIYTMVCKGCSSCVPIRLDSSSFQMNRNQKRVWHKNKDLEVKIAPLQITNEKLAICDKFLRNRFPDRGNSALEYYAGFFVNTFQCTYEIEFWVGSHLVGVSIVDVFDDSINCVYFYFDPDQHQRSPGTFNILYLLDYGLQKKLKYLYLGYWIKEIGAMNYKSHFKPHELLIDGKWQSVKR